MFIKDANHNLLHIADQSVWNISVRNEDDDVILALEVDEKYFFILASGNRLMRQYCDMTLEVAEFVFHGAINLLTRAIESETSVILDIQKALNTLLTGYKDTQKEINGDSAEKAPDVPTFYDGAEQHRNHEYAASFVFAQILTHVEKHIGPVAIAEWFRKVDAEWNGDDKFCLRVESEFIEEVIRRRCGQLISDALNAIGVDSEFVITEGKNYE